MCSSVRKRENFLAISHRFSPSIKFQKEKGAYLILFWWIWECWFFLLYYFFLHWGKRSDCGNLSIFHSYTSGIISPLASLVYSEKYRTTQNNILCSRVQIANPSLQYLKRYCSYRSTKSKKPYGLLEFTPVNLH